MCRKSARATFGLTKRMSYNLNLHQFSRQNDQYPALASDSNEFTEILSNAERL